MSTIEAFLPQFHLMYACDSVDIYHIVPLVAAQQGQKRTRGRSSWSRNMVTNTGSE